MNVNELKRKIIENGMNIEMMSLAIGMNKSTFYRKMRNRGETFTVKEVNLICKRLSLSKVEAMVIFFGDYVA
ncbi:XRE family transcriptional regulator [Lysinibacillus sp. A4]|jgi:predicted RNase H-like nuclease (RuvC/YqgF family)|uniref:XRE family transcriptional regulator n=1 Tax=Lysinibacillus TaxID=400634 RepID=UPI001C8B775B|nr:MULTISPECIES: XRE family transcriptional regulator [Lysinibacillus]MBX8942544.1 XRE family transcriptional regulator [Lysinibacillus sp. K60]MCS5501893.1 XRE family transcriptional regulator [Lysinibacillus sp. A4]WNN76707.1 XRE family transcriptional regulator [Lysinibacillus capsici]